VAAKVAANVQETRQMARSSERYRRLTRASIPRKKRSLCLSLLKDSSLKRCAFYKEAMSFLGKKKNDITRHRRGPLPDRQQPWPFLVNTLTTQINKKSDDPIPENPSTF
jgi:hypothetical protein